MDRLFKVPATKISSIYEHPNAEKLSLASIYGFQVVIPKDVYKVGDVIIYIPIDSLLPQEVEDKLFGKDAKIKLEKGRVRQIKIRGQVSQGMITLPETLGMSNVEVEKDYAQILNITKYEPPVKENHISKSDSKSRKNAAHPDFLTYNGLTNLKWMPKFFEGKQVVVTEKLHGTNARAGMLPYRANTLLKKIKKFLGLTPLYEFVYGSNRVDITNSSTYTGFYGEDVYGSAFKKLKADLRLEGGEIVFGEIIGPGIQKGYDYGLKEHKFILFDVMKNGEFLNPQQAEEFALDRGFEFVPVLYSGLYDESFIKELSKGPSVFNPVEKVREGVVVKLREGYSVAGQKQALKVINEDYLADKNNTDFN